MTTWTVPGRVTRVVDGDTLVADLDLGWGVWKVGQRVRLAQVNCPELKTDAGLVARHFAIQVLDLMQANPPVTVVSRSLDKYGRVLGHVILADGRDLGQALLANGHAVPA